MWECELIDNLLVTIGSFRGVMMYNLWDWRSKEGGDFLVRSTSMMIEELLVLKGSLNNLNKQVFGLIWMSSTPSKVVAFSWTLLIDCIPVLHCNVVDKVCKRC